MKSKTLLTLTGAGILTISSALMGIELSKKSKEYKIDGQEIVYTKYSKFVPILDNIQEKYQNGAEFIYFINDKRSVHGIEFYSPSLGFTQFDESDYNAIKDAQEKVNYLFQKIDSADVKKK